MATQIAIIGASGYIGKRLVAELICNGDFNVRVLVRKGQKDFFSHLWGSKVEIIEGDLRSLSSLQRLFVSGCTVVNLAYLWKESEVINLEVANKLVSAGTSAGVRRLIHCSTADVVGRTSEDMTTEATICLPVSKYGRTKLNVERIIIHGFSADMDTVVLRPTAVFGPNSANLKKLSNDLLYGNRWCNYLRSCLFGKRRMNLVHVSNVLAAIFFAVQRAEKFSGEVINVSTDDELKNNFSDVEAFLMNAWSVPHYRFQPVHLPLGLFSFLLLLLGKNNINPRCNYDPSKLKKLGCARAIGFEEGLADYATWYRMEQMQANKKVED